MSYPQQLPLFPLPEHVLLIGMPVTYRLFEPRYVAMARWLAKQEESARWLAIPRLVDTTPESAPRFDTIAALAQVTRLEPLGNEQWLLVAEGVARCRLSEIDSPHPFRLAEVELLHDHQGRSDDGRVVQRMRTVVEELARQLGAPGVVLTQALADANTAHGIDRLAALLLVEPDQRQAVLEDTTIGERAKRLLRALGRETSGGAPSLN